MELENPNQKSLQNEVNLGFKKPSQTFCRYTVEKYIIVTYKGLREQPLHKKLDWVVGFCETGLKVNEFFDRKPNEISLERSRKASKHRIPAIIWV